ISPGEGCGGCLRIGASPIPATTSSIQAGGSPQQRFPWWSMRCDTGRDMATVPSGRTQEMLDGEAFGLGTERSTFAAQRLRLLSRALRTSHSLSWVVPTPGPLTDCRGFALYEFTT